METETKENKYNDATMQMWLLSNVIDESMTKFGFEGFDFMEEERAKNDETLFHVRYAYLLSTYRYDNGECKATIVDREDVDGNKYFKVKIDNYDENIYVPINIFHALTEYVQYDNTDMLKNLVEAAVLTLAVWMESDNIRKCQENIDRYKRLIVNRLFCFPNKN